MELQSFTDKNTKLQFVGQNIGLLKEVPDYPLIDWTKQYMKPNCHFIDIGSEMGAYSFILSPLCETVHTFQSNEVKLNSIILGKQLNNIKNMNIYPYNLIDKKLDELNLKNICFININGLDIFKVLEGSVKTLKDNHYPPIMLNMKNNNNSMLDFTKKLGYQVFQICGCTDMYLASDHPKFKMAQNNNNNNELIKQYKENNYTVETLIQLMNDSDVGLEICDKLTIFNHDIRNDALINIFKFIEPIEYKRKINLNCPMKYLRVPNNPSIINLPNGDYLCNIRCSNYVYEPHFQFLDGNIHVSEHMLLTLSPDFMVKKMVELVDKTNNYYFDSFVKGIDDLRLIDDHRFICSHGNFNNRRIIEQCLGTFDENGNVTKLIPLKGPNPNRHEKNWIPLIKDDGLYVVYMFNPFILYKVNEESGELILVKQITIIEHFNVKGSTPFIPYRGGLLGTVHHTTKDFAYLQRFIWMDKDLTGIKYSIPFYFQEKGVEFMLGMCHSPEGLILANSIRDNYSNLKIIDYRVVDEYLGFEKDETNIFG